MHRHLLYNGEIRSTSEPLVSPGQTGYMNGWGIFSTLRVLDGVLFAYERHYARMKRDAPRVQVPFEITEEALKLQLAKLIQANDVKNATLRVAVVRNHGGTFEGTGITRDTDIVVFTADLTVWGESVKLYSVPNGRHAASPFAGTKVLSWLQNLTWYEEAHQRGFDEVVLLNEHGHVSECTSANIFAILGNRVMTPPLETSGCLPGVTRALLLEEIRTPGLTIAEQELTPADLENAEQVFITSTTRDLLPVASIDGQPLKQAPEKLSALRRSFSEYQHTYVTSRQPQPETAKA